MTETSHFGQEPEPHDAGLEVKPQEIGLEVRQLHSNLEVYQVYNPHQTSEQRANRNEEAAYKEAVPQKKIFGLPRQTFWLLVVLAVVVISGVVGGGVGGSVAVQKAKSQSPANVEAVAEAHTSATPSSTPSTFSISSSSTTTAAPATYTPPSPSSLARIDAACPPSPILIAYGTKAYFNCLKSTDLPGGDLVGLTAYSIQQCIDACTTMNVRSEKNVCIAISVGAEMSLQYTKDTGSNCWLKGNGTTTDTKETWSSARLCVDAECKEVVGSADPK